MPSERVQTKSSKQDQEEFVLFIFGIPSSIEWQELKDMLRAKGIQHARAANTQKSPDGTKYGECVIKGKQVALQAYDEFLTHGWNGRRLGLALCHYTNDGQIGERIRRNDYATSPHSRPSSKGEVARHDRAIQPAQRPAAPNLPTTATHCLYPMPYMQVEQTTTGVQPGPPYPYAMITPIPVGPVDLTSQYCSNIMPNIYPPTPATHQQYQHQAYASVPSTIYRHQGRQPNRHVATAQVLEDSVNAAPFIPGQTLIATSRPARVSPRSIHIADLPYNYNERQVQQLLSNYGPLESCSMRVDSQNARRRKGFALARFLEAQHATAAVSKLNGLTIMGRKIRVKFDQDEPSPVAGAAIEGRRRASAGSSSSGSDNSRSSSSSESKTSDAGDTDQDARVNAGERSGPLVVDGARGKGKGRRARGTSRDHDSDSTENDDAAARGRSRRNTSGSGTDDCKMDGRSKSTTKRGVKV